MHEKIKVLGLASFLKHLGEMVRRVEVDFECVCVCGLQFEKRHVCKEYYAFGS